MKEFQDQIKKELQEQCMWSLAQITSLEKNLVSQQEKNQEITRINEEKLEDLETKLDDLYDQLNDEDEESEEEDESELSQSKITESDAENQENTQDKLSPKNQE